MIDPESYSAGFSFVRLGIPFVILRENRV